VRLTELSFDDWIEHTFSHAVRHQRVAWFLEPHSHYWDPEPDQAVAYLTRLFSDPEMALRWFSDSQIAQGLTYLISTSASGDRGWLYSAAVPANDRISCIEAVASLFTRLFEPRCTPHLSHHDEAEAGPLNGICYMWWDEFPCIGLPSDPHLDALHNAALRTMKTILDSNSLACQESALHGLGHWQHRCPKQVAEIVDDFLRADRQLDPRIVAYAKSARCGCVQ
jgi:hypothetical protein